MRTGATCQGCGKPIVWGITEDGKRIPLDPRPPVYRVVRVLIPDHGGNCVVERERAHKPGLEVGSVLVSHFATCPKANEFSASGRETSERAYRRGRLAEIATQLKAEPKT